MKKPYSNPHRHYRTQEAHAGEQKIHLTVEETDLLVTIPAAASAVAARDFILKHVVALRRELKIWSEMYPEFQSSLIPLPLPCSAPDIITRMYRAGIAAKVGPFAAVAGAVSQCLAEKLAPWLEEQSLPIEIIVENGGDTFLVSSRERRVGILVDPEAKEQIGVLLKPEDFPVSLCASSAKIGHSLSLGQGDLAMVRAKDAALADAFATAYCNMLHTADDVGKVIKRCQKDALQAQVPHSAFPGHASKTDAATPVSHSTLSGHAPKTDTVTPVSHSTLSGHASKVGVEAVFVQCEGNIGAWGNLELIAL